MRFCLFFIVLLFLPITVSAEWVLTPEKTVNGGVAILRWHGAVAMDIAVARFNGDPFFLDRDKDGLFGLIGVDVLTEPGFYPIELASVDMAGMNFFQTINIEVIDADRKTDFLTLPPEMVSPKDPATLKRIARDTATLKEIFNEDTGPYVGGLFVRPVPDRVSSQFGTRRVLNGEPKSPHSGTDFRSSLGRLVRAPAHGRVAFVGDLYYTGNTVIVDHGSGIYSLYAHLLAPLCKIGQKLDQGQPLGKVGSTGRSTGAHLHWTVKIRGAKVDPLALLARYGKERP